MKVLVKTVDELIEQDKEFYNSLSEKVADRRIASIRKEEMNRVLYIGGKEMEVKKIYNDKDKVSKVWYRFNWDLPSGAKQYGRIFPDEIVKEILGEEI
jgi:hypothetical protein